MCMLYSYIEKSIVLWKYGYPFSVRRHTYGSILSSVWTLKIANLISIFIGYIYGLFDAHGFP